MFFSLKRMKIQKDELLTYFLFQNIINYDVEGKQQSKQAFKRPCGWCKQGCTTDEYTLEFLDEKSRRVIPLSILKVHVINMNKGGTARFRPLR